MGAQAREGKGGVTYLQPRFLPYVLIGASAALLVGIISLRVEEAPLWALVITATLGALGQERLLPVLETWRRRVYGQRIRGALLAAGVCLAGVILWPGVTAACRIMWPVAAGIGLAATGWWFGVHRTGKAPPRRFPFWAFIAYVGILLGLSVVASLTWLIGNSMAPDGTSTLYYFSSFFQGYAAILGMTVTALLVSLQLAAGQYGLMNAPKRLLANPWLWVCLSVQTVVIVTCAVALALSPMSAQLCSCLAGTTFVVGVLAIVLTIVLIREVIRGLGPVAVMRGLAGSVGSASYEANDISDALERLSKDGWYLWTAGLGAYLQAIDQKVWRVSRCRRAKVASRLMSPLELVCPELSERHRLEVARQSVEIIDRWYPRDPKAAQALMTPLLEVYWQESITVWAKLLDRGFEARKGTRKPTQTADVALMERVFFIAVAAGKEFLVDALGKCLAAEAKTLRQRLKRSRDPVWKTVNDMLTVDSVIVEVLKEWFSPVPAPST